MTSTGASQQAADKATEIESKVNEFFDAVNEVLSWVPDFLSHLIDPIVRGMEQLKKKLQEFWREVSELWEQPGHPERLMAVAKQWESSVGNGVASVAGDIAPTKLRTSGEWNGRAAEAYRELVPAQSSGLGEIELFAEQLRRSLESLANSIETFWLAVKAAFVVFVVGVVGAIATACTVVGIPAAIAAIATAVTVSLGLVITAVTALNSHVNTIEAQQSALNEKIHDLGTEWATTNVDLSDSTTGDGDRSNWEVDS